jgi:hypothetical protein
MHQSAVPTFFTIFFRWVEVENKNASLNITPTHGKSKMISLFFNKKAGKTPGLIFISFPKP